MRRITHVKNGENVLLLEECKDNWSISTNKMKTCYWVRGTAVDRLAAYEKTGLTPEEIITLQEDNMKLQKLLDDIEEIVAGEPKGSGGKERVHCKDCTL